MQNATRILSNLIGGLLFIPLGLLSIIWALNVLWAYPLALFLTGCLGRTPVSMQGKNVFISGGSSGIGLAVARLVAQRGARAIIIAARNVERLNTARDAILASSPSATVVTIAVDLTASAEAVQAALSIEPLMGDVDYAVLSAGDSQPAAFEDTPPSEWERLLRLNVLGCVWPCRVVLPGMRVRRSGRIVFISSLAGRVGVFGFTAYSASKFALGGFAEALRMEVKPYNIGVTSVLPPDTDTPLLERENIGKPSETKRISEGSGLASADAVARATVTGMCRGDDTVYSGLDGWMLSHLTIGMNPSDSWQQGCVVLFLWPLLRLVGLAHTYHYDSICREEHAKRQHPGAIRAEAERGEYPAAAGGGSIVGDEVLM